jgi:hypothetical protein
MSNLLNQIEKLLNEIEQDIENLLSHSDHTVQTAASKVSWKAKVAKAVVVDAQSPKDGDVAGAQPTTTPAPATIPVANVQPTLAGAPGAEGGGPAAQA